MGVSSVPTEALSIRVESNATAIAKRFGAIASEQLPFATSRALNTIALEAQRQVRADLPKHFVIRSPRPAKGIQVRTTGKKDWPNQFVVIGDKDEFMVLQETGGTKTPQRGAQNVAIPSRLIRPEGSTRVVPQSLKPRGIGAAAAVVDIPGHGDLQLRYNRVKKRRFKDKQTGEVTPFSGLIAYFLRKSVHLDPRFHFYDTISEVCGRRYGDVFARELDSAIRTAR